MNINIILHYLLFSASRQRVGGGSALQGGEGGGARVGDGRGGGGVGGVVQQGPRIPYPLLAMILVVSHAGCNVKVIVGVCGVDDALVTVIPS